MWSEWCSWSLIDCLHKSNPKVESQSEDQEENEYLIILSIVFSVQTDINPHKAMQTSFTIFLRIGDEEIAQW